MDPRYLDRVVDAYMQFFHHYEAAPLVIVNAAEIDFAHGSADCEHPFGVVRSISKGRHYLDPLPLQARHRRTMDVPGVAVSRCRERGSMRVEGATHRAADEREVMKRFELLSIIGSMVAVGITLGAVVIGSIGNLRAEVQNLRTQVRTDITDVRTEMQTLRAEVNTEMQALRTEVNTEMQTLRAEVSTEMQSLRAEVNTEMQTLRTEVRTDIADVRTDIRALEHRLVAVERRQARTEGLLEGLRDAITAQGRREDPLPAQREST